MFHFPTSHGISRQLLALLCCVPFLGLLACHAQPWRGFSTTVDAELVWPHAPEKPRIAYVTQIRRHQDLFTEGGGFRTFSRWITGQPDSAMVRPHALALHPSGGLLVSDPGRRMVHFFRWGRRRYLSIGPARPGGLPSPVGLAVLRDGRILVSDSRLGSIESFSKDGRYVGPFCSPDLFERPAGMGVSEERGEIYVADVTTHRVAVLDMKGRLTRWLGDRGAEEGKFNFPTHLEVGPGGMLAVTDTMNFRVQLFRPDGTFVRAVGRLGNAPGSFAKPKGVAMDAGGLLMVVEGLHDALQFFSAQGELLLSLGSPGSGPAEFWLPAGLCFDEMNGLLFVADGYNSRVQVFRMLDTDVR